MKKIIPLLLLLIVAVWWFSDSTIQTSSNDINVNYRVKYTESASRGDTLPMLVALHGNGDTMENFYASALNEYSVPVRIILIEGPIASPGAMAHAWPWNADTFELYSEAINEAIELLAIKYPTKQKPILLGFSGGGMMAYYQAIKFGSSYSYVFPISGRLSQDMLGDDLANIGADVIAFHGKSDGVVSINGAKVAIGILKEKGASVHLTEFDGGHQGVFRSMKSIITQAVEEKILILSE